MNPPDDLILSWSPLGRQILIFLSETMDSDVLKMNPGYALQL